MWKIKATLPDSDTDDSYIQLPEGDTGEALLKSYVVTMAQLGYKITVKFDKGNAS
jgi:hypothetical protein